MFEFSIAGKYLVPRRKRLSMSLIALMSIGVITLVVWLVLLFLSINEGIQKTWIAHITSLNAPLQITPTDAYFDSYYYQIDTIAERSNYAPKTLGEKLQSKQTDPYNPDIDAELPTEWSNAAPQDLVKDLHSALVKTTDKHPQLVSDEYQLAAGLMQIKLLRYDPNNLDRCIPNKNLLSQATYLKTFCEKPGGMDTLFLKPSSEDIEKLLVSLQRMGLFTRYKARLFDNIRAAKLETLPNQWVLPKNALPEGQRFSAYIDSRAHITLSEQGTTQIVREGAQLYADDKTPLSPAASLYLDHPLTLSVTRFDYARAHTSAQVRLHCQTTIQKRHIEAEIAYTNARLIDCDTTSSFIDAPESEPLWPYFIERSSRYTLPDFQDYTPVMLPKTFVKDGVRMGDIGSVSYAAMTATATQQQDLPFIVCGFYDPGIMNVGMRFLLAPPAFIEQINSSTTSLPIDRRIINGFQLWHPDIKKTAQIKRDMERAIEQKGLGPYFTVTAFYEHEMTRELLEQFQSEQYLFTLVAIIILAVACSNIISLLAFLVNDKKKEIGILRSMGATTQSIALIFGLCGTIMGFISTGLGITLAYMTLKHIDTLISVLSTLQGHPLFTETFYGASLPNSLSHSALIFVFVATPLIALFAGLVPAIKACRMKTTAILRSEG